MSYLPAETIRQIYNKKNWESQRNFLRSIRTLYIPNKELGKVYKLLTDLDFLDIKANHTDYGIQELIADYNAMTSQSPSLSNLSEEQTETLQIIRDALVLSVNTLEQYPDQLVAQLLGRLMYFTQPEIIRLVQQVENHSAPYLVPRNSVLMPPSQKLVRTLEGHEEGVRALVTVPLNEDSDQSFLIISGGEDRAIKIWNGLSGNLEQILSNHTDTINALACTKDGKYIFSGAANGEVITWKLNIISEHDIEAKPLHNQSLQHRSPIKALTISENQKMLFIASGNDIHIHEWETNTLIATLRGHTATINCLLCDRHNQNLYSGGDDGLIYIWNLQSYQQIGTLKPKPEKNVAYRERMENKVNFILSMCLVNSEQTSNRLAAIFGDGLIHEFEISKQSESRNQLLLSMTSYQDFYGCKIGYINSFDYKLAVASNNSFAISQSNNFFNKNPNIYNSVHVNSVSAFCISPDDKYVISAEKEIKIWRADLRTENEIVVTPAHNKPITHIQIAKDKNVCISASDGFLRVWDLTSLAELWNEMGIKTQHVILCEGNSDILATLSQDKFILFSTDNGEVFILKDLNTCDLSTIFLSDGIANFAFASNKSVDFQGIVYDKLVAISNQKHQSEVVCLALSPMHVASASIDGIIQISDMLKRSGTIYLADKVTPKSLVFVYLFRLLVWLSNDSIIIYDGLIDENMDEEIYGETYNISTIFKTKGCGYQKNDFPEYIVPTSHDKRMAAIYCPDTATEEKSYIEIIDLQFIELVCRIPVNMPNLVSWQFDIDARYLVAIYDSIQKNESIQPIPKNLIVWELSTGKKCCEFVTDLQITSYMMSSQSKSVIIGDAGGRLQFLHFKTEEIELISLNLNRILNLEYQNALKSMIDLDLLVYEAPRLIEKHFDTDKHYEQAVTDFFKSIFYLVTFNYPKFIDYIKKSGHSINFASDTDKQRELFDNKNLDNIEIVLSYDANNHEAYWIKGKIYLKRAKKFFDEKEYKQGKLNSSRASNIFRKAYILAKNSSKINDKISQKEDEADELRLKCFFWQPISKIAESYGHPLETGTDIKDALALTNSRIDLIKSDSNFANIPDLLPRAYIYKAKLLLLLGNADEAIAVCDLALDSRSNPNDSDVIYGIMADAYRKLGNLKLEKKFRRQEKSIGGKTSGDNVLKRLWAWGDQFKNDPYLDDRVKFFMVKIVTPLRVFLFYFIPWVVLFYFLNSGLHQPIANLIVGIRQQISQVLNSFSNHK